MGRSSKAWSYRRYSGVNGGRDSTLTRKPRPNAKKVVSAADKDLLEQYGAAVVECSWVRIKEVPWGKIGGKCERLRMAGVLSYYHRGTQSLTRIQNSAIPRCRQLSELRTSLAIKLRRSPRRLLFHLRARRLGARSARTFLLR